MTMRTEMTILIRAFMDSGEICTINIRERGHRHNRHIALWFSNLHGTYLITYFALHAQIS